MKDIDNFIIQKLAQYNNSISSARTLKKDVDQLLTSLFLKIPAKFLIKSRSDFIDGLLKKIWNHKGLEIFSQSALISVGGYGRQELFPFSDIDILILYQEDDFKLISKIESFLTYIWDLDLHIGHSVRSLENAEKLAQDDVNIYTSLLDARFICGNKNLLDKLLVNLREIAWPCENFLLAKIEEQTERHQKYQETAYWLEPNIKNSPGGLRDIHTINWITQRFNLISPTILLKNSEISCLQQAQEILWNIRYGLHLSAQKKEDQLLFDHQLTLSKEFGYNTHNRNHAVELFMHVYFKTAKEISLLNNLVITLGKEYISFNICADATKTPSTNITNKSYSKYFIFKDNHLGFHPSVDIEKKPWLILAAFALIAEHPVIKGLQGKSIRTLRNFLITREFFYQRIKNYRQLFIEILNRGNQTYETLQLMNDLGVLGCYIADFKHVIGLMQYDLFHIYTVDQHSLFVIRNIQYFFLEETTGFDLCKRIVEKISNLPALYIAGLFHDIGKGLGGNHAEIGAAAVRNFCLSHKIPTKDTALITWLVKNHLLMSQTAQRNDIQNPDVISQFSKKVKSIKRLDYLYLLTVADIVATNKKLWNSWKDSLLKQLYFKTKDFIISQSSVLSSEYIIREKQKNVAAALSNHGFSVEQIHNLWDKLGNEYFLREQERTLIWQTKAILTHENIDLPLIAIQNDPHIGATEVFVFTKDQDNLFATTTAVLDKCHLNVVEAHIITSKHNYSLDTYIVLNEHNKPLRNKIRIKKLQNLLLKYHHNIKKLPNYNQRRIPLQMRHFTKKTLIKFKNNNLLTNKTEMIITASDRPGLLARIGHAFMEAKIRLHDAKIITLGDQVEDIFYVTDQENNPLLSRKIQSLLRSKILLHVDT